MKVISGLIPILLDATRLDVFDAHYSFSAEQFNITRLARSLGALPRRGVLVRSLIFAARLGSSVFKRGKIEKVRVPKHGIVAPCFTDNGDAAARPVVDRISGASLVRIGDDPALSFNSFRCRIMSLPFFCFAIRDLFKATPYQRTIMSYYFDEYWNSYGYYVLCRLYLRTYEPKAIMVSNDHSLLIRTIVLAARDARVPSIFMQHAAVSNILPPLIFDYAFLDGRNSLKQCLENGDTSTEIFVAGIPKMDFTANWNRTREEIGVVGVATNPLDDLLEVKELCLRLKSHYPDKDLILRPHQAFRQHNESLKQFCCDSSIEFSDPYEETANDFLTRLDILVSGQSTIHLEATLLNILSLYFPYGGKRGDHYGFLEAKLIRECATIEQLIYEIDRSETLYPDVRSRAKPFCGSIDTRYDGHSAELIARTIQDLLETGTFEPKNAPWVVSEDCSHAYVLEGS